MTDSIPDTLRDGASTLPAPLDVPRCRWCEVPVDEPGQACCDWHAELLARDDREYFASGGQ